MRCGRCGAEKGALIGSFFDTEMICLDTCRPREQAHPKYAEARAAELAAVRSGDFNFPGIGLPPDLRGESSPLFDDHSPRPPTTGGRGASIYAPDA